MLWRRLQNEHCDLSHVQSQPPLVCLVVLMLDDDEGVLGACAYVADLAPLLFLFLVICALSNMACLWMNKHFSGFVLKVRWYKQTHTYTHTHALPEHALVLD